MATVTKPPILDDTGQDILTALNRIADAKESKIVSYGGSLAFASLPNPIINNLNVFYLVTDSFTTDSRFVEGSGVSEAGGQYWIVIDNGTSLAHDYKYDKLGSLIDLSTKQNVLLTTPLTISSVTRTSVEDALGALNDRVVLISDTFTNAATYCDVNITSLNVASTNCALKYYTTVDGLKVKSTSYNGSTGVMRVNFKHAAPSAGTLYIEARKI